MELKSLFTMFFFHLRFEYSFCYWHLMISLSLQTKNESTGYTFYNGTNWKIRISKHLHKPVRSGYITVVGAVNFLLRSAQKDSTGCLPLVPCDVLIFTVSAHSHRKIFPSGEIIWILIHLHRLEDQIIIHHIQFRFSCFTTFRIYFHCLCHIILYLSFNQINRQPLMCLIIKKKIQSHYYMSSCWCIYLMLCKWTEDKEGKKASNAKLPNWPCALLRCMKLALRHPALCHVDRCGETRLSWWSCQLWHFSHLSVDQTGCDLWASLHCVHLCIQLRFFFCLRYKIMISVCCIFLTWLKLLPGNTAQCLLDPSFTSLNLWGLLVGGSAQLPVVKHSNIYLTGNLNTFQWLFKCTGICDLVIHSVSHPFVRPNQIFIKCYYQHCVAFLEIKVKVITQS